MSNGKGDTTRPPSVPRDTFAANWDRTFGPKYDTIVVNGSFGPSGFRFREHYTQHADGTRTNHLPDSPDAEA